MGCFVITVKYKTNPFKNYVVSEVCFCEQTLSDVLKPFMQGFEFQHPTVVRVDTVPVLRKDWNTKLSDNSVVEISPVVGAPLATVLLVANVVMLVGSVAFTAYGVYKARKAMQAFRAGQGQAEASPFFSIDGKSNRANLNNPVEVGYGRNRMWPSYITRPYRTFKDDRLHGWDGTGFVKNLNYTQIFCIGQGAYDIHCVKIGDTPIETFRGVTYEIVPPGESSKSLAHIVYVQPDFKEISITSSSSTDLFLMTPAGVASNRFEIDVEFPTDGNFTIVVLLWEVDINSGSIISEDFLLQVLHRPYHVYINGTPSYAESNPPAHRHTFSFVIGDSTKRYKLKIENTTTGQTFKILEIRSFFNPKTPIGYADKTLLIVNYFLIGSLEKDIDDKVNVIATRKLEVVSYSGSNKLIVVQPTRSMPWAFRDALINKVYGGGLDDSFLDIETLMELDQDFNKSGLTFDNVFNQNSTVEDVCKVITAAGRCSMAYNGSRLTLVRDSCKGPAEAMFSCENILEGSFSWSSEMFDPVEPDCIEASYVETETGQQNTVIFTPENSPSNNVQKVSIVGVNKTTAWREAANKMRRLQLVRDTFKFKTGMEGYIPSIGSVAILSSEMLGMGYSGYVVDFVDGFVTLSRYVSVATGSVIAKMVFRRDDGSVCGPFNISSASGFDSNGLCNVVKLETSADFGIDFSRTDKEPVHFVCWPGNLDAPKDTKIQIESVTPSDDGVIEISASNYNAKVYEFDNNEPPEDEYAQLDPIGEIPQISWVEVSSVKTPKTDEGLPYTRLVWGSVYGATKYQVSKRPSQAGPKTLLWEGIETFVELALEAATDIYLQVDVFNGVVAGIGYLTCLDLVRPISSTEIKTNSISYNFDNNGVVVSWDGVLGVKHYEVRVVERFTPFTASPWYVSNASSFKYTKAQFKIDFGKISTSMTSLSFDVEIRAVFESSTSQTASIVLIIDSAKSAESFNIVQDPQLVIDNSVSRHRTLIWKDPAYQVPGTVYNIHMETYISGYDPATFAPKPWNKIVSTETCSVSTNKSVGRVELSDIDIQYLPISYGGAPLDSEGNHPVYGPGCMADVKTSSGDSALMNPGELQSNTLFIYDPEDPDSGYWHPLIKFGTSQVDGIVWVAKATQSYLTGKKFSILYPITSEDSASGSDYRVKGAVIADNGWFDSSTVSLVSFDVDH